LICFEFRVDTTASATKTRRISYNTTLSKKKIPSHSFLALKFLPSLIIKFNCLQSYLTRMNHVYSTKNFEEEIFNSELAILQCRRCPTTKGVQMHLMPRVVGLKGTVSRDFRPSFFSSNNPP
jgi:hypothetical protein